MMDLSLASSYRDVELAYVRHQQAGVRSGEWVPFVYPFHALGMIMLGVYLLIPQSALRFSAFSIFSRYFVFALVSAHSIWSIRNIRSISTANGFGVGLISSWTMLWAATLLVFNDVQRDFARIQRKSDSGVQVATSDRSHDHVANTTTSAISASNGSPRQRSSMQLDKAANGQISTAANGHASGPKNSRTAIYFWQPYPQAFTDRLYWVTDLVLNYRGIAWNWRSSGLPPPPKRVRESLEHNHGASAASPRDRASPDHSHHGHSRASITWEAFRRVSFWYFTIDAIKVIIMRDPYFWGFIDAPAPSYLPSTIAQSPVLLGCYRQILSLASICAALQGIYSLGPLVFVGILGKWFNVNGEPWMYPDGYGSYRHVLDNGLAGWWGGWWHQTFRTMFSAPSQWLIEKMNMNRKSPLAKMLQLVIAFSLSGVLHACGSYTNLPPSRPMSGSFLFFILQPVGIMVQIGLSAALKKAGITARMPKYVRQAGNFIYVHVWLYYIAPLLTDDFARQGLWLFEPVPISPLRGLGFGAEGEGWVCYKQVNPYWYQGEKWWQSGVAI
ncbi:hypothetical protein L228DRAFT_241799 [Xylona heveae TC161]|uniref:Wax synthase domain-containing protein n=1 Tax=Xylona heveae (strain CBS 132557 / TC161) TaxID=1328760 RepID=A0A164ZHZ5_XYLHT|nr:hypothetical protein L228DRAFT_241799 [Xylona heveae TC161]KZF19120.1 hypothetical protein L228DRAFT_241799 [Xylona heveae TC161]